MEFSNELNSNVFFYALILGIILSFIYDIFRILRRIFKFGKIIIAIEDVLFWLICIIITFQYMLKVSHGNIRFYIILGELLGGIIHHFTIGAITMKISDSIIFLIKHLFKFIYKITFKPFFKIINKINKKIGKIIRFLSIKFKIIFKKLRFHLKKNKNMMYNTIGKNYRKQKNSKKGAKTQNGSKSKIEKKDCQEEKQTQIYF